MRPYDGDGAFLAGPTARTTALWARLTEIFTTYRKTHNDGVFDAYTSGMPVA